MGEKTGIYVVGAGEDFDVICSEGSRYAANFFRSLILLENAPKYQTNMWHIHSYQRIVQATRRKSVQGGGVHLRIAAIGDPEGSFSLRSFLCLEYLYSDEVI